MSYSPNDYSPVFRSPITVKERDSTSQNLNLSDLTGVSITLIQGAATGVLQNQFSQIPANPGDLVDVGDGLLARLTAEEFYLFGKSSEVKLPAPGDLDDGFAHATDMTHGRAALRLVGSDAPEMLSKICGLDFHDAVFPNMQVAQTSAARIRTLIARYDEGDTPAYFLHVNRPFGQYFWEIVWDAGQEFGIASL